MVNRLCACKAFAVLLSVGLAGLAQENYLDVLVVKVKPERRAAFDALAKKIADANRRNHGDTWVALETVYGEQGSISLISTRGSYADVDKGFELFYAALNKTFGAAGATRVLQDFNNTTENTRGEIRRRRFDLSANAPADPADLMKRIGGARWVRTTLVHVRPGQVLHFEEQLKALKEGLEKGNASWMALVSQSDAGQQGMVFYVSWFAKSLSGFDNDPALPQILGQEGFRKFLANASESVESTESIISRFVPEISNPPEGIVSAAPDFWNPKPVAPKPKAGEAGKGEVKEKK